MFKRLKEDILQFHCNNMDPKKVIKATYFSAYKKTVIVKVPFSRSGLSIGIIFLGNKAKDENLVKHEYGHRLQLEQMGLFRYLKKVFFPSVTANLLDRLGRLPYDYYGSPWEAEADRLGGVKRKRSVKLWPENAGKTVKDLLKML